MSLTQITFFMKEPLPRSRIKFLFTLIHQSIKGIIRPLSEELRPVNTEIDLMVGEVVREQAKAMSTGKYSLVAGCLIKTLQYPRHLVTYYHIPSLRV